MPFHLLVYMVAIGLDFDKWIIWFFNMIKERNEEKRSQLMEQLRELEIQKIQEQLRELEIRKIQEQLRELEIRKIQEQIRELEVQKNIGKSLEMPRNYIIKQTDLEVLKR